ncbi:TMEM175 family protein [uncultured Methanofollis sp.]|uniref:TMEM175 family protein n=1 Tax=uncultured Methanofollis sp. TaxID=262500 RepID=UPI0026021467|nr:TMEM175 family protein [uncultured Methanofollis sp.]
MSAFADGVFAIVITLLVLELPVPEGTENLLLALLEEWPDFLAYVISFVFIGGIWMTHASITQLTEQEDAVTFRLTLLTLFFVSLMPFTTSMMAGHLGGAGSHLAVLLYGRDLFIASVALSAIMRYLAWRPKLLVDGLAEEDLRGMVRRRRGGVVSCGIGVLLALFVPLAAVAVYIAVTAFFFVHPLIYKRAIKRSLKE